MDDGGYITANDVDDDFALQTNIIDESAGDDDDTQIFGSELMAEYINETYIVWWVWSGHMDSSDKLQQNNLFQIFFIIKDYYVRTIIDGGSCNNMVTMDFV
jgi:hypothetical protein